jgi:prepilin-type N-terminal cleavage/methylation domain-containing protein
MYRSFSRRWPRRPSSFTLIELLVVIAIIAILAALTLMAGEGVMTKAARSRTQSEIQAMSAALEGYKADNGLYPSSDRFASTNSYTQTDGSSSGGNYQASSEDLYEALSGQTNSGANYNDQTSRGKTYYTFTLKQLGNYKQGAGATYVQDPFGYGYGYFTGDTAVPQATPPANGTGMFDLWSTGGILQTQLAGNPALTNTWISNWQ